MRRTQLAACLVAVELASLGIICGQETAPSPATSEQFCRLDKNSDGAVRLQEIGALVPFRKIDDDGDDGIALSEIQAYLLEFTIPAWMVEVARQAKAAVASGVLDGINAGWVGPYSRASRRSWHQPTC